MALYSRCTRALTYEILFQKFANKKLDIEALNCVVDLYMMFAKELDRPEESNHPLIRSYIVFYASMLACAVSDVLLVHAPQMFDHHQGEAERKYHDRLEEWLGKAKSILPDIEASQPGTHLQKNKKSILYSGFVA